MSKLQRLNIEQQKITKLKDCTMWTASFVREIFKKLSVYCTKRGEYIIKQVVFGEPRCAGAQLTINISTLKSLGYS